MNRQEVATMAIEVKRRRLVASAPALKLSPESLEQIVGWSSERRQPVTLREFVAARASPAVQATLRIGPRDRPHEPVKRVTELNDDELKQTVIAILQRGGGDKQLAVVGDREYSSEELVAAVLHETDLGQRLVAATRRHIDLLEQLVLDGKVRGLGGLPAPVVEMRPFDF